ncbi:hypothetical protein LG301_14230 [Vreelandella venusta]|uniref:DUF7305 domain-containing protein n=1 Tax=Vreelandella venusta TaxID=44935 RepID=UPI00384A86A6
MKKQQKGAALFVVMALLSASMVVGMSAMQSSLVDERLAGNFRSSVQAQMTAENTLSSLVNPVNTANRNDFLAELVADPELLKETEGKLTGDAIAQLLQSGTLDQFIEDLLPANFDELDEDEQRQIKEELLANLELQFEVDTEAQTVTITSWDRGLRNNAARDSALVYSYSFSGAVSSPFEAAIVGCEGISVSGGSTISSYRSSDGVWNGQPGSFATSDKPLISTTSENANIDLIGGNEQVHGGAVALGGLILNGSSQIFGNIFANQMIRLNGGGVRVRGDVESLLNVVFGSSARVDGAVRTEQDVHINNWSASIGEGIYAGGTIITGRNPPSGHIDQKNRSNFYQNISPGLSPLMASDCDTFDFSGNSLKEEVARYQNDLKSIGNVIVNNGVVDITMTPSRISVAGSDNHGHIDGAEPEVAAVLGEDIPIYYVDSLQMASTSKLHIKGGDVALVIGDDFSMGGGGAGLVIDPDSSLTVFVKGQVKLNSNVKMPTTNTLSTNGKPTFSIFSSYESNSEGIDINASNRVVANIYAPFTKVNVNSGGSLFGSVKAREVTVVGGAKIVYDELLADAFGDSGGESSNEWCSFNDLSPLTIASPVGQIRLPSSQAEFNGKGSVPDITVTQDDLDKFSDANAANNNIQGGIPDGLFNRGQNAEKFHTFIEMLRTRNETVHVQGRSVKNNTSFGSMGNEQITFVSGTIDANNISGAGVLVVKGDYKAGGNPDFNGLIVVLGDYSQKGGGGRDLNGALLVAPYDESRLEFTTADIEFRGGGSNDFNYDEAALRTAFRLLDSEEQASWGNCNVPPPSGDGELIWSLIDWR